MLRKRVPWSLLPFLTIASPQALCWGLLYVQGSAANTKATDDLALLKIPAGFHSVAVYLGQNEVPRCAKTKWQTNKTLHHAMMFSSKSSRILTEATVSVIEEQGDLGTSDLFSSNYFKSYSAGTS